MKIQCLEPRLILNPLAVELITLYGNYTIRGQVFKCKKSLRNLYNYDQRKISVYYNSITEADLPDCYITDYNSGETYPLYVQVPCGHCDVCKSKKVSAFVHRCELETQCYDNKPIFLTLTYDEKNKPKEGLCLRDVQLFFKRFRQNLYRNGYRKRIRYVCVGEYGRRTHRPHYHAILWNCGQSSMDDYRRFKEILEKSWSRGFVLFRQVDPSDNKAFYYTSKYLRKDNHTPEGCCSPFVCSSNRGGGIGSRFIDGLATEVQRRFNVSPQFVNRWNGQVKEVQLNKYILNRLLPTISTSIPSRVKKAMRTLHQCYAQFQATDSSFIHLFDTRYQHFTEVLGQYIYVPQLLVSDMSTVMYKTNSQCLRDALEADMIIDSFFTKHEKKLALYHELSQKRYVYLSKLFLHSCDVSDEVLKHRAYKFRVSSALAAQCEIF